MVGDADELLDKCNMVRAARLADQLEAYLLWSMMPFPVIAFQAGAYEIFPGIPTTVDFGNDMVDGHLNLLLATVLAAAAIALENILARQHYSFCRDRNIEFEPYHRGDRDMGHLRSELEAISGFNDLSFAQIKHYDGTSYTANGDRLKVLI